MFQTFVIQPIFNLLVLIYSIIPGHNFGVALIVFTIVIRLLLWPLVKKQLHQTKLTRQLQPELKRIKKEAAGDRQKESLMMMELYKEKGISPFGALPTLIVQTIVLIGLYSGLSRVIKDPHQIYNFAYGFLQNTDWLKHLAENIKAFDNTLLGLIDLSRPAVGPHGFYLPAFLLVAGSAIMQYVTGKQIMPTGKNAPKFSEIFRAASEGKQADAADVNAAMGRFTVFMIPAMVFLFTINLAAALSLYWLVGSTVAYFQQRAVLGKDEEEMETLADEPGKPGRDLAKIAEAEIVSNPQNKKPNNKKKKGGKKRRR